MEVPGALHPATFTGAVSSDAAPVVRVEVW
jgi:hypothetical protein